MSRRATVALLALVVPLLAAPPATARPGYLDDHVVHAGQPGYDAEVVTTPGGVTLAVWASGPYGDRELTYAVHRPGRAWTSARPVADTHVDLTSDSPELDLVLDGTGRATAVWSRTGTSTAVVTTATWTASRGWSTPLDLTADGDGARYVHVFADPDDRVTALWSGPGGLVTRDRPPSGSWGPRRSVPGSAPSQEADVATDATGHQVVVWLQNDGVDPDVDHKRVRTARRSGPSEPWSTATWLVPVGNDVSDVHVETVSDGAVAIWRNRTNGDLEARRKPPGTRAWQPVRAIGNDAVGVYVDSSAAGLLTVVVERSDPDRQLVTRRYRDGTWAPRELIATDVDSYRTALDVSRNDRAGVQFRTTDGTVWTSNRTANGWTDPHELGLSQPGQVQADGVGVDDQGNLVALWNAAATADLTASVLDAGRPVTRISRLAFSRSTGRLRVEWGASDRWSPITGVTVELRFAKRGGGFSPWRSWPRPYTLASHAATATVAKDKRWCVHVRTTDGTGSSSRFVTRCTPLRR